MAIKIATRAKSPITIEDFVLYLKSSRAVESFREGRYLSPMLRATATELCALARNKSHILAIVINQLKHIDHFQLRNNGQPQSFVLYHTPQYILRLMLWLPAGHQARSVPFSYDVAHDHAFDLMTVGFFGPGYRTSLYEYNYREFSQQRNGQVRLDYKREMTLREHEVIYYFANKDVHTQHEPTSLSASLNLIILRPAPHPRQTVFDLQPEALPSKVCWCQPRFNSMQKLISQRSIFCALATHGNQRSKALIEHIANCHEAEEAQALAWLALLRSAEYVDSNTLQMNKSSFVKNLLRQENLLPGGNNHAHL